MGFVTQIKIKKDPNSSLAFPPSLFQRRRSATLGQRVAPNARLNSNKQHLVMFGLPTSMHSVGQLVLLVWRYGGRDFPL